MAAQKGPNYLIPIKQLLLDVFNKKKNYLFIRSLLISLDAEKGVSFPDALEDIVQSDKLHIKYYGVIDRLTTRIINLAVGSNYLIEVTIVADFVYHFMKEVEDKSPTNPVVDAIGRLFSLLLLQNCSDKFLKIINVTLPGLRSGLSVSESASKISNPNQNEPDLSFVSNETRVEFHKIYNIDRDVDLNCMYESEAHSSFNRDYYDQPKTDVFGYSHTRRQLFRLCYFICELSLFRIFGLDIVEEMLQQLLLDYHLDCQMVAKPLLEHLVGAHLFCDKSRLNEIQSCIELLLFRNGVDFSQDQSKSVVTPEYNANVMFGQLLSCIHWLKPVHRIMASPTSDSESSPRHHSLNNLASNGGELSDSNYSKSSLGPSSLFADSSTDALLGISVNSVLIKDPSSIYDTDDSRISQINESSPPADAVKSLPVSSNAGIASAEKSISPPVSPAHSSKPNPEPKKEKPKKGAPSSAPMSKAVALVLGLSTPTTDPNPNSNSKKKQSKSNSNSGSTKSSGKKSETTVPTTINLQTSSSNQNSQSQIPVEVPQAPVDPFVSTAAFAEFENGLLSKVRCISTRTGVDFIKERDQNEFNDLFNITPNSTDCFLIDVVEEIFSKVNSFGPTSIELLSRLCYQINCKLDLIPIASDIKSLPKSNYEEQQQRREIRRNVSVSRRSVFISRNLSAAFKQFLVAKCRQIYSDISMKLFSYFDRQHQNNYSSNPQLDRNISILVNRLTKHCLFISELGLYDMINCRFITDMVMKLMLMREDCQLIVLPLVLARVGGLMKSFDNDSFTSIIKPKMLHMIQSVESHFFVNLSYNDSNIGNYLYNYEDPLSLRSSPLWFSGTDITNIRFNLCKLYKKIIDVYFERWVDYSQSLQAEAVILLAHSSYNKETSTASEIFQKYGGKVSNEPSAISTSDFVGAPGSSSGDQLIILPTPKVEISQDGRVIVSYDALESSSFLAKSGTNLARYHSELFRVKK